ncbi:hypothetical protein TorRG33x02_270000 [Trema orientale]|uniref:Uncharacterized protein n=1 Tax=Trema orientale TaxID=63057 RepID=A0A2P5CX57_TREOI|nr:hypothetical protein TorRG33x02_270000 [Trema orientale]
MFQIPEIFVLERLVFLCAQQLEWLSFFTANEIEKTFEVLVTLLNVLTHVCSEAENNITPEKGELLIQGNRFSGALQQLILRSCSMVSAALRN